MKRTLILTSDSTTYYYMCLENGESIDRGRKDWADYEWHTDALICDLEAIYGKFDYVYWM